MIQQLHIQEVFFLFTGLGTMVAAAWLYTQRYSHLAILAGIRSWSVSLVLTAVGWILLSQGRLYPLSVAVIPANVLLMAGFMLQVRAYAVLLQRRMKLTFLYAAMVSGWLGLVLFGTVIVHHPARVIVVSVFYALAGFTISGILFSERQAGRAANLRFLGSVYFLLALGMLLRAGFFSLRLNEPLMDIYSPGGVSLLLLLISFITSFFPTLAFIGLCNQLYEFRFRRQQVELQRLSEELSMQHRMAEQILTGISGFIYRCSADERRTILYASDTLQNVTGFPVTYFGVTSGRSFGHLMHSEDAERVRRQVSEAIRAGEIFSAEYRIVTAQGRVRWLRDHAGPVYSESGALSHFEGIATDITLQMERDSQLAASEKKLSDLINSVDGIVWEASAETFDFSFVSGRAENLLGFSREDWLTRGFWLSRLHPDDRSWAPAFCKESAEKLEAHEFEYRFMTKDGRTVWLRDLVTVVAEAGRPRWLRGIMIDITARKKNEERLEQLNFMYSLLSSCRRVLSEVRDESQLFQRIVSLCAGGNKIKLAWIGIPAEQASGIRISAAAGECVGYLEKLQISADAAEPQGRGPTGTAMREAHDVVVNYPTGGSDDFWTERRRRFGFESYAAVALPLSDIRTGSLNLYSDVEGFFTAEFMELFDQLATDIGAALDRIEVERWRTFAEQNIRENQLLLDFALESTIDAVWDMDVRTGAVRFFRHWEKMLGFEKGELENDFDTWQKLIHPDDLASALALQQRYLSGEIPAFENSLRVRSKAGDYLWIKNRGLIVERDAQGNALRAVGTLKNIDLEVRRAEEARRNAILLDAVFDASPVGITIIDSQKRLLRANPAVEKLAGIRTNEDLAEAFRKLTFYAVDGTVYDSGTIPAPLALVDYRQPYSDVFGFRAGATDEIRWISMSTSYLPALDLVVRISTEVTDVIRSERLERTRSGALTGLAAGQSLTEVLELLVEGIEHELPGARASILLLDDSGRRLRFAAGRSLPADYNKAIDGIEIGPAVGSCGTAAFRRERVIVSDIGSDELWRDYAGLAKSAGLSACWSQPVFGIEGALLGTFAIYHTAPHMPQESEIKTVEAAAGVAAVAVEYAARSEQLRRSELKFRTLFEALPVAVSLHDISDSAFIDGNLRLLEYAEISLEQLKKGELRARLFFDRNRQPLPFSELPTVLALAENRIVENSVIGYKDSKKTRWFEMSVIPMTEIGIYASISKEVTVEFEQQEALAQLAADLEQRVKNRTHELEEINAELEAFSYSLSHDLKAPLTRAQSWLNILLQECRAQLGEKGAGFVAYVASEIRAMEHMTQAMLSLARAAQTDLHFSEVNLSLEAEEILAQLRDENPSVPIETGVSPGIVVWADADLVRLLLRNLLENAVKFSRGRNPAQIEFGMKSENGENIFYVHDNGVGFDMRYADRLFAPFQRLHSQAQFPGTGIGLATAQRIVHRHGGRIWADSQPDQGAWFYFTVPQSK